METVPPELNAEAATPSSNKWRKARRSGLISGLGVGGVYGALVFVAQTIHVAPVRLPEWIYDVAYMSLVPLTFGVPLIILGCVCGVLMTMWFRDGRTVTVAVIIFIVLFTPIVILAFRAAFATWSYAFVALADRSKPLVVAIEKFESEKGHPPQSLRALVPEYIPEVPWTRIGSSPTYDYRTPPSGDFLTGNWYLGINVSDSGLMDWDTFFYDPKRLYDESNSYDSFKRFGDWAYRHD